MTAKATSAFVLAFLTALPAARATEHVAPPVASGRAAQSDPSTAAAALAAKFSDAETSGNVVAPPALMSAPAQSTSEEPETVSIISAISASARAVGDHAADKAATRAKANAEKRKARAREARSKKAAQEKLLQAKRKLEADSYKAASQTRDEPTPPEDEPSLLAKIFNPANWSLPAGKSDTAEKVPDRGVSSAFKPEE